MIRNEDLYKITLSIARKDRKGNAFSVGEFNRYLQFASNEYFNQQVQKYEASQKMSESLGVYKVSDASITVTTGTAPLPAALTTCTFTNGTDKVNSTGHTLSNGDEIVFTNVGGALPLEIVENKPYFVVNAATDDFEIAMVSGGTAIDLMSDGTGTTSYATAYTEYFHLIGEPRWGTVAVDVVTEEEYAQRSRNSLVAPSATYPIAKMSYNRTTDKYEMKFYPAASFASETVTISYLRRPEKPVLDYYITTSTLATTYLGEGEAVAASGKTFPLAGYTPSATNYYSQTVEMDWPDFDKVNILYIILSKAGLTIDRADLAQYFDQQRAATNTI